MARRATRPALKFTPRAAAMHSCAAAQLLPMENVKSGTVQLTTNTELGKVDGTHDTVLLTVKVRIEGIEKTKKEAVFFTECDYRQRVIFDSPVEEEQIDIDTAERLLKPLYYLSLNQCQEMAWRMGHVLPRTLPEVELFRPNMKKKATSRAKKEGKPEAKS